MLMAENLDSTVLAMLNHSIPTKNQAGILFPIYGIIAKLETITQFRRLIRIGRSWIENDLYEHSAE